VRAWSKLAPPALEVLFVSDYRRPTSGAPPVNQRVRLSLDLLQRVTGLGPVWSRTKRTALNYQKRISMGAERPSWLLEVRIPLTVTRPPSADYAFRSCQDRCRRTRDMQTNLQDTGRKAKLL